MYQGFTLPVPSVCDMSHYSERLCGNRAPDPSTVPLMRPSLSISTCSLIWKQVSPFLYIKSASHYYSSNTVITS